MTEYKYKKIPGCKEKKFTENGHTMFEFDVLQRLNRLETTTIYTIMRQWLMIVNH